MITRCQEIEVLDEKVLLRAASSTVDELSEKFVKFSSIETIERITEFLMPRLEKFSSDVGKLYDSNLEIKEVVLSFDQSLSMKFNKSEHLVFKNKLDETYMKHEDDWPRLLERFDQIESEKLNRDNSITNQITQYKD
jgi:hypothetical protein